MEKGINFAEIPQTAVKVLTSPAQFFREMPKTGGFIEPLVFMVVMGVVSGLIQSVFSIIGLNIAAGVAGGIASIIIMPVMIAIFGFIGAAILYVIWKVMGSQESYETAYRCGAYISALTPITTVLGLVPYLGGVAGIALMTFYLVIASMEVHRIASQKAWLVFGIIGAVFAFLSLSGEFASKKLMRDATKFQKEAEEAVKTILKQADQSEKANREMQKQVEEAMKEMEEMKKQAGAKE